MHTVQRQDSMQIAGNLQSSCKTLNVKLVKQRDGEVFNKFERGPQNERGENVSKVITNIWFQEHPRHLDDENRIN